MSIEKQLIEETNKWKNRIEAKIKEIKSLSEEEKKTLANINAYIKDSEYFLKRGDLIRAFEAVIWAWALYEINFEKR
ncbi:MAG: DUF357 domain-containing protein [Candidatus Aenigmatarchaeota archaeon]